MAHPISLPSWCIEEAESLLRRVAVIPAPSLQEDGRVSFISGYLRKKGIPFLVDEAKNVIIPYGDDGTSPLDVYAAHTDVVFPDTRSLPLKEDGTILRCPGIADDSAHFVAILIYALFFHRERPETERGILFVCNSAEEGLGNLHGTRSLFRSYGRRIASFTSFDDILGRGIVSIAVGSERYRIAVRTEGGHSYADFGRPNAIAILSSLIERLYRQRADGATYNVGTIEGGTSVNSIAEYASCTYEIRSTDEKALMNMRKSLEAIIESSRGDGWEITSETIGVRPCAHGADTKRLEEAAEEVLRRHGLSTERLSSSTDCNIPLSLGIPAICFGLIYGGGRHTREEWVDLSTYPEGLQAGLEYILSVSSDPASH